METSLVPVATSISTCVLSREGKREGEREREPFSHGSASDGPHLSHPTTCVSVRGGEE